jgi:hypothetical protein
MFHKTKFSPIFPEKYVGDHTNIICRSSWERTFANWCDKNPDIVKWSSEETIVPYRCPTDGKIHRYFVDFKITTVNGKTYLVEVKPAKQCEPPVYPGRNTQKYITESMTYIKNQAKWAAAREFCKDRRWEFKIITEYELGLKS